MGGTLAENIAFSRWAEPVNMEKVHNTCHRAAIDFIDKHPDGPMMHIGNQGQGLSGGQAQRVSIARALYADPQVLIFDEATSALDIGNERLIQNTIQALGRQITCIIIAHRLSTVEQCDRIIWMEGQGDYRGKNGVNSPRMPCKAPLSIFNAPFGSRSNIAVISTALLSKSIYKM